MASDGGIFSYGDAGFYGSTGSMRLNKPVVGMAATPDGKGYWLVASDGGIFSFGDAQFYGIDGQHALNKPVVGMASTPDGERLLAGRLRRRHLRLRRRRLLRATGSMVLNKPIIGMIPGPSGAGYFLVASDGGMFQLRDGPVLGSLGGVPLKHPIVAAAATPGDNGLLDDRFAPGLVSNFGSAELLRLGALAAEPDRSWAWRRRPGNGSFVGGTYPSGAYGYDISNCPVLAVSRPVTTRSASCRSDGASALDADNPNPCLAQEAGWAGGGLNLYTYLDLRDLGHERARLQRRRRLQRGLSGRQSRLQRRPELAGVHQPSLVARRRDSSAPTGRAT